MSSSPRIRIHAAGPLLAALCLGAAAASAAPWVDDGVPVCVAPGGQAEPVAAPDGAGGVLVAWTDHRGPAPAIYVVRLTAGGAVAAGWPVNGRPVTSTSAGQYNPAIVADGSGGALIAWVDRRGGAASAADLYAQHVAGNGSIAAGWAAGGLPVCRDPLYQGPPVMCADGAGGAYVAARNGRAGAKSLITVTRFTGAGVFPPGWSECGYALGDGTWHESDPQIAPADGGGVIVVWSDWRLGGSGAPDIMAARLTAAGSLDPTWGGWVCRAAGPQVAPVVIADGTGGALLAWQDGRGDGDIYASRIAATGAIAAGWPVDGAEACTSPGLQYGPRIVTDGAGGAIIAWSDDNAGIGNATEIRAQRLSGSGTRPAPWPAAGVLCHLAPCGSILRALEPDGTGGAILAVEDALLSTGVQYDVYVDHLTGLGVLDKGRFPACREAHQQQETVLVGDGSGGAILAWQDLRNTPAAAAEFTLYAQHVGASDVVLDVGGEHAPAAVFALEGARPNPARGDLSVAFSLPDATPATLDLIDVSGRRLRSMAVGSLGAGRHVMSLAPGPRLRPGICWLKLTRAGRVAVARVVVLR